MITIFKYTLDAGNVELDFPVGAKILTVAGQNDTPCIWAEVDTEAPTEKVIFEVYGTGHEIKRGMGIDREHIGTVLLCGGSLVWHVYRWCGI